MTVKKLKILIVGITCFAVIGMMFISPISQDPAYHKFADSRTIMAIPYFWNVVSNVGFLYVGALGLYKLYALNALKILTPMREAYGIFLLGITLVAFGSGFYHWTPSNDSLLWDRLPMTLAFMALLSIVLAEFVSIPWGQNALLPLLMLGVSSALYWYWGERQGEGDLRPYVLVQFLPIILMMFLVRYGRNVFDTSARRIPVGYFGLMVCYVLAKLFEHFDGAVYEVTMGLMAGHAIKHAIAALGLYFLLRSFEVRTLNNG